VNLNDLLSAGAPDYQTSKQYALLLDATLRDRLAAVQAEHGDPRHRVQPVALTDGRWMLCADLLTEVGEGGLFASGFAHLDPQLFSQVEVVPMADALALLPQAEEADLEP
jgi:hypothetical protein